MGSRIRSSIVLVIALVGCARGAGTDPGRHDAGRTPVIDSAMPPMDGGDTGEPDASAPLEDGAAPVVDAGIEPDAGRTPTGLAVEMLSRELVCKLIHGESLLHESENRTHTRFNLRGTDLGTPAIVGDQLHLFFGDTHGFREIWHPGEDPDSVARVSLAAARADIRTLCRNLDFYVTSDNPSVANDVDPQILRDFEGGYLLAPPGERIRDYIDRPVPFFETNEGSFAGSFEVPSGAISHNGKTYVYWSTRPGTGEIGAMRLSFLARWETPGSSPLLYRILHRVDALEWGRPLGGHFLQIAPVIQGEYLYLFGTGRYRQDGVHLARKRADDIETAGGYELYDPRSRTWRAATSLSEPARAEIPAVIDESVRGIGELGVQYVEEAGLYVIMYQQLSASSGGNRMVLQTAERPEGPWASTTVIHMQDPAFVAQHCCIPGGSCPGERVIQCDEAGLYGIYPLPLIQATPRGDAVELSVPFVASTWNPYGVVLFRTTVSVRPTYD